MTQVTTHTRTSWTIYHMLTDAGVTYAVVACHNGRIEIERLILRRRSRSNPMMQRIWRTVKFPKPEYTRVLRELNDHLEGVAAVEGETA